HTHLAFPPAGIRAADTAAAVRAVHTATGQRLEARTRAYLEAMARHGTTTAEVKSGCGFDEAAEIKLLRMLHALRRGPVELIPSFLLRLPPELDEEAWQSTKWLVTELLP